tara:strand:+ start:1068 stop:1202 length:135 start_codon:yes stop_codon:yes gene_type:complete
MLLKEWAKALEGRSVSCSDKTNQQIQMLSRRLVEVRAEALVALF